MSEEHTEFADKIGPGPGHSGTLTFGAEGNAAEVGKPEISPERKALVQEITADIKRRKGLFSKAFQRMREDMAFVRKGASKEWAEGNYVVHIAQRHVQQRVSSLYAKNPTAVAKRRKTVDYVIWDGNAQSLASAQQVMAVAADPASMQVGTMNPAMASQMAQGIESATALLMDVAQAQQRIQMLKRLGQTLECLFHYYIGEDTPTFKLQAKQLVRRVVTCGIGYVKLGFQRIMGQSSTMQTQIADFRDKVAHAERLANELAEKKMDPDAAGVEELRLAMRALMAKKDVLIREGLVFDFPRSTAIIPDEYTRSIKGWVGTRKVAEEFMFTPGRVRELFGVDLGKEYTAYNKGGNTASKKDSGMALVWQEYDKDSGLMYTVCDGYCDFLEEPTNTPIELEQFFPFFPLAFNDLEGDDDNDIFPPSDVHIIKHPVMEVQRARESLRQHRRANRPFYGAAKGVLDDTDKTKMSGAAAHEVVEFNGLAPGEKIADKITRFEHAAVDPALYDVGPQMEDILRAVGSQEANLGPTSGATATESSIAEGSRLASQASAIDDVDDMLSLIARASSQVMLAELNAVTVTKIAGPGAIWPQMSNEDIAAELWLEVSAGSSGRPNKAQEIDNWQKMLPMLIQTPGIAPMWLAKEMVKRLDDRADLTEAVIDGMPSITAMNSQTTPNGAQGADQGNEGTDNGPRPEEDARGSSAGGQPGAMKGK